ncbi:MAG: acyltransferase [Deferribacteraceae bacterium]|jgi:peptidoglycan/LPS O-acetylase OafA/YrhL|nr:acyltransferase [Deferribacteraceae bacterium]
MYRNDIEGLRALAVLFVLIFHSKTWGVGSGFIGVDIFFIISGFLITHGIKGKLDSNTLSVTDFWNKRLWRLQPLMLSMLVVTFVAVCIFYMPRDFTRFIKSLKQLTYFFSNNYFGSIGGGYFSPDTSVMPLLHTWSLSVEWLWYLILPFLLIIIYKISAKHAPVILLALTAIFAVVSLKFNGTGDGHYYSFVGRIFEFLIGTLVAYLCGKQIKLFSTVVSSILSIIAIVIIVYIAIAPTGTSYSYPNIYTLIICVCTAMIILAGAYKTNVVSGILSLKPFVLTGNLSYSIYIWHWPLFAILHYAGILPSWKRTVVVIIASYILAWLSYTFVENKFRQNYKKYSFKKTVFILFVLPFLVGFILYEIALIFDGVPQRLGQNYAQITKIKQEYNYISKIPIDTLTPSSDILLVGDSFAEHYRGFVSALADDAGVTFDLIGGGGCPLLEGFIERANRADCIDKQRTAIKNINAKKYRVVILGGVWPRHAKVLKERFAPMLEETVQTIVASGAKPIFINNNYDAGIYSTSTKLKLSNQGVCASLHITFPAIFNQCDFTDDTFDLPGNMLVLEVLNNLKAKYSELMIIDLHDIQCKDGICATEIDGYPIYLDNAGHITNYASYRFGEMFLATNENPLK